MGILGEGGTHSWEETIFISDNEKQKFYANSKDQLSTERPSSVRDMRQAQRMAVRWPGSCVYAIPERLVSS